MPHSEILNGGGDQETLDVFFWQSVIDADTNGLKVHVKSVGCKSTLASIAHDVHHNEIDNIRTCFDRDYDFQLNRQIRYKHVFYTYGYSWENDVLTPDVLNRIFWTLRNRTEEAERVWSELEAALLQFSKDIARYTEYDLAFVSRGACGLYPRDKPAKALDLAASPPKLNSQALAVILRNRGFARGPQRKVKIKREMLRNTYGHLLACYVYHLFGWAIRRGTANKVKMMDFVTFMRSAIAYFSASICGDCPDELREYLFDIRKKLLA